MAQPPAPIIRVQWRCVVCKSRARDSLMASMDPRWMLGHCSTCHKDGCIFERVGPER